MQDIQFGLLLDPLPEGPDQEESELIATQIEEEVPTRAVTQPHLARRTGAEARGGTSRSASGTGSSSSGRW